MSIVFQNVRQEDCDKCIDRSHMRNYANEMLERGRVNPEGGFEKADEYEWSDKFGFDRLSIKKRCKTIHRI